MAQPPESSLTYPSVVALARLLQGLPTIAKDCPGNCGCNAVCGCESNVHCCENKCGCECKGKPTGFELDDLVINPMFTRVVEHFDQSKVKTIKDFEQIVEDIRGAMTSPRPS